MKGETMRCRFCREPIAVITWGVYRKIVVDAEAKWIIAAEEGEEFVRIDGSKVRGRIAEVEEIGEPAYRMHGKTCGVKL